MLTFATKLFFPTWLLAKKEDDGKEDTPPWQKMIDLLEGLNSKLATQPKQEEQQEQQQEEQQEEQESNQTVTQIPIPQVNPHQEESQEEQEEEQQEEQKPLTVLEKVQQGWKFLF